MSEQEPFVLCGGAIPPIGFGTPVFVKRTSNALWAQSIDVKEIVTHFLHVDEMAERHVTLVDSRREQRIGLPALFLYADVTGHMQIGCRLQLEPLLRNDFQLAGSPRVKRSIARFLNEPDWIAEAEREIDGRRKQRVRDGSRIGPSMLIRGVFHAALRAAVSGTDVMIRGARGSGKTALLMWLAKILGERHGARVVGPLQAGPFRLGGVFADIFPRQISGAVRRAGDEHEIDKTQLVEALCEFVENHISSGRTYFFLDDVDLFDSRSELLALFSMARKKTRTQFSIISATASVGLATQPSYRDGDLIGATMPSTIQLMLEPLSPAEAAELVELRTAGAGQDGLVGPLGLEQHAGRHLPRSLLAALNAVGHNPPLSSRDFERLMMEYYDLALDRSISADLRLSRTDASLSALRLLNMLANDRIEKPIHFVLGENEDDWVVARMLRDIGIIDIDDRGYARFSHAWFRDWWRAKTRLDVPMMLKSGTTQLGLFDDQR